jgi:hypothetical protein
MGLGAVVFGLWSATIARADDQQLVEDYLATLGASGAVVRPITDDYVGRTFPSFSFFGVIFRKSAMRTITRRLRRLEERFAPQENEEIVRLVALLRERRRRRAEACGEAFEDRPYEGPTDQNRPVSIADILRSGRRRVARL